MPPVPTTNQCVTYLDVRRCVCLVLCLQMIAMHRAATDKLKDARKKGERSFLHANSSNVTHSLLDALCVGTLSSKL